MRIVRVGVDLAKDVFQLHGVDRDGKTVWQRKLNRNQWIKVLLEKIEPGCVIGMEACGCAHQWARLVQSRGFVVKLIAPQFVKPYVKSNKNDVNDAEAICEAMSRPHMRFVNIKSVEQQDIQATHRIRAALMDQRKAKSNQIRGLLSEYGLVAPREICHLRKAIPDWLEEMDNGLTDRLRRLLHGVWQTSMSNKCDCWDTPMESFFGTLKTECLHHYKFKTRDEAKRVTFEYIEVFYNQIRRHAKLNNQAPAQFAKNYHQNLKKNAA